MHYRRLGKTGIKVSEISLGAWVTLGAQVDEAEAARLLHTAYERGVNFFDNADVYAEGRAEEVMGRAIRNLPREALVLSSKVFWPTMPGPNGRGLSRKHITESLHASLRRLQTDYVDLYFCHRYDPDTPIDEVVHTMSDLVQQGKILYWGTSEWRAWQIAIAWGVAQRDGLIAPVVEQPQYNMLHRRRFEIHLAPMARDLGLGMVTWSPLAFGLLSGKYNDGIPEGSRATLENMAWMRDNLTTERIAIVRALSDLASQLGLTTAQLAIAWLLRWKELSSVITGASRLSQLEENLKAADAAALLTEDVLENIEQILGNTPDGE
ncbi:MAG: aldo/keto reductase family protein [Anaerolineales bacterium]